jgi:hypothetical protein
MLLAIKNKASMKPLLATPLPPVFPVVIRQRKAKAVAVPKSPKRENTFSKSRDTREDRGARQMKTTHSSQTFTHAR